MRRCSKTACQRTAMATLTYNYADSTVVVGPLSRRAEPHTYDLCEAHAASLTAPKGWEVLRLELPEGYRPVRDAEETDLLAVASAVREPATRPEAERKDAAAQDGSGDEATTTERPAPLGPDGPARPGRPGLRVIPGQGQHREGPAGTGRRH